MSSGSDPAGARASPAGGGGASDGVPAPAAPGAPRRRRRRIFGGLLLLALLAPLLLLRDTAPRAEPRHSAELVEAGGLRWRVLRAGAGDTTVVLVHGFGEHLLVWRWVLDRLASRYRVVAPDLPGFGASEKPERGYTLAEYAERLDTLLRTLTRPPRILVGHSMGGAIVAELLLRHPDRAVAAVLIAPSGLEAGLGHVAESRAAPRAIAWWEAARAFMTPLHDPAWLAEPAGLAEYDPALDPAYRTATESVLREFDFEGIGSRFADLRLPVLVIWGRYDPVIPFETAEQLAGLLPCDRFAPLSTLHRPQVERPDTVAALILSFLARPDCG